MGLSIASWNVNSIKARLSRVEQWLVDHPVDILGLQELKSVDEAFPTDTFRELGYHAETYGQKTYNGVAIVSRQKPKQVRRGFCDDELEDSQARLIDATLDDVRVINVYVPNGQEVGSDKFAYKLAWLKRLRGYLERHASHDEPLLLCGDFNCAPDDALDVARVERWGGGVLTHPEVRNAVKHIMDWGLEDTFRKKHPKAAEYSWWDYRMLAFPKNDGLRIDLVLATESVIRRMEDAWIDRDERKGKKPSDHAPVAVTLGR